MRLTAGVWAVAIGAVALALACVTLLAFAAAEAGALVTRPQTDSFGPDGSAASAFTQPDQLALDQTDDRLFALNRSAPPAIHAFDLPAHTEAGGAYPLGVEATGNVPGLAVDNTLGATAGNLYYVSAGTGKVFGFDSAGSPLGVPFPLDPAPLPPAISKFLCGAAVDSSGDLWVADFSADAIRRFDPATGVELGSVSTAGESTGGAVGNGPCYVAFDSNDDLYVGMFRGDVFRYEAPGYADATLIDPTGDGSTGFATSAVAVDTVTHIVYVAHATIGVDAASVHARSTDGALLYEFGEGIGTPTGIAVDEESDEAYVSVSGGGNRVHVFGPAQTETGVETLSADDIAATTATLNGTVTPGGLGVSECFFEYDTAPYGEGETPGSEAEPAHGQTAPCEEPAAGEIGDELTEVHAEVAGLEPNGATYHFRLVAAFDDESVGAGEDEVFQTLGPVIGDVWSEGVTEAEATIKAQINPQESPTTFHVEYGSQGPCSANPCQSTPVPDGEVGEDSEFHEVNAPLEGLTPGTTYHWRVLASNEDAASEGPDRTFTTYLPPAAPSCPNAAVRTGPSAALPDCRAYEMVSPVNKGGGDIVALGSADLSREAAWRQASADGERLTYTSSTAFGDAQRATYANQYLASRGAGGWSTEGLLSPLDAAVFDPDFNTEYGLGTNALGFSEDLCAALLRDENETPLAPAAIPGFANLYLRDNCGAGAGTFKALTTGGAPEFTAPGVPDENLLLSYARLSADGDHVFYGAGAALDSSPAAAENGKQQLYDYDLAADELRLASVLPGGEADPDESALGSTYRGTLGAHGRQSPLARAVSADGSRWFWSSRVGVSGPGTLYASVRGGPAVQVSAGASAIFLGAASDGSAAIYQEGSTLFLFDLDKALAAEPAPRTKIADQVGGLVGASEDLERIYFTSRQGLGGAEPPAAASDYNLYLREGGGVSLIATVSAADRGGTTDAGGLDLGSPFSNSAHASPDGSHLAFMSNRPLKGHDNADAQTGEPLSEVYLYDAEADELRCASCNPSGARPQGSGRPAIYIRTEPETDLRVAAWLPTSEWASHLRRALSEDGRRLYFNAFDALLPEDTNGAQDVYQWEAPGSGTCTTADPRYFASNGGCLHLISTGKSPQGSEFLDASVGGEDAFLTTSSSLDPLDPGSIDVYDARVGGGFPPPPPEPPACEGDACQTVPPAPEDPTPASSAFQGSGNVKQPRPSCGPQAKHAERLARRAKRARSAAKRAKSPQRGDALRRRAERAAKQAERASRQAKRCHQQRKAGRNRRAQR